MRFIKNSKILIIGLGLMGGSYAQALTDLGYEVGGLARRQEVIDYALNKGYIRHGGITVEKEYIGQFDVIVFALYPHIFIDWLRDYQDYINTRLGQITYRWRSQLHYYFIATACSIAAIYKLNF